MKKKAKIIKKEKIGKSVYKAFQIESGQNVALKKIKIDNKTGIPYTAIREISMLKQLEHPNVIKLLDIIQTENKVSLMFEYLDQDLGKLISSYAGKGLDPTTTKSYLKQMLQGIQHCHINKVLHRDLKPGNLLINREGQLKIADFDLAIAMGYPTKFYSQEIITQWYRPPEVLLGTNYYTTAVDIWSAGCIFAEMVKGEPLFPGLDDFDTLNLIFSALGTPSVETWPEIQTLPLWNTIIKDQDKIQAKDIGQIAPGLSASGLDLLQNMLQINPQKRPSATECLKHAYFLEDQSPIAHQILPNTKDNNSEIFENQNN